MFICTDEVSPVASDATSRKLLGADGSGLITPLEQMRDSNLNFAFGFSLGLALHRACICSRDVELMWHFRGQAAGSYGRLMLLFFNAPQFVICVAAACMAKTGAAEYCYIL